MIGWICSWNERYKGVVRKIGRYKDNIIMDLWRERETVNIAGSVMSQILQLLTQLTADVTARPYKVITKYFVISVLQWFRKYTLK